VQTYSRNEPSQTDFVGVHDVDAGGKKMEVRGCDYSYFIKRKPTTAMNLPFFIELMFILGMAWISFRMLRFGFAKNLIGLLLRLLTILGGWGVAVLIFHAARFINLGFFNSLMLSLIASGLLFALIDWRLRRRAIENRWSERLTETLRLPSWFVGLLNGVLVLLVWFLALVTVLIFSDIASLSPEARKTCHQTLLFKHLIDVPSESMTETADTDFEVGLETAEDRSEPKSRSETEVRQARQEQSEFYTRFSQGLRQTKQQFYDATGLEAFKEEIDRTRRIINLPPEDKAWLLTHHPQLKQMIDHPAMIRVLDNQELMERFDRFATGRIEEVLLIGADPDMQQLLEDSEVKSLIQDINLSEMLRQCKQRHQQD